MRHRFQAVAVIATFAAVVAHADERAARDCVAIANDQARLACYDAAFKRPAQAAPAATAATASEAASSHSASAPARDTAANKTTEAAAAAGASSFGVERMPKTSDEPEETKEIKATIAGVSIQSHGHVTVTLDNGQVWEQLGSVSDLHQPRKGDPVSIRKASFGSYLMYNEKRGSSRVQRVQ